MIKASVEYINSKLAVLNYCEKSFGLCEIITKGDKSFPAQYKSKGEYTQVNNFDKYNGVSYLRKRGDVTISDEDDTLQACSTLSSVNIPLRMVIVVPIKKLDCDNEYSEDVIAQTIMRTLLVSDTDLKASLSARTASLSIDSYSTDSAAILGEEYSNYGKTDINYKFAYLSLDITINAVVTQDCLTRDCYGVYS